MLKFAAKHFRDLVNVVLWIVLIGCTIAGAITGYGAGGGLGLFLGGLFGLVGGALINVVYGGMLAIFLNMAKDIKNMNMWMQYMWQHHLNTDANHGHPKPFEDYEIHYFGDENNDNN